MKNETTEFQAMEGHQISINVLRKQSFEKTVLMLLLCDNALDVIVKRKILHQEAIMYGKKTNHSI